MTFVLAICLLAAYPAVARAADCTLADFTTVIDRTGKELRALNAKSTPLLRAKLTALRAQEGWSTADTRKKSLAHLHDTRMAALDREANALLGKFDQLGDTGGANEPDCANLVELKKVAAKLISTVQSKSTYTLAKLDKALKQPIAAAKTPLPAPAKPATTKAKPKPTPKTAHPKTPRKGWKTTTALAPKTLEQPQVPQPKVQPSDKVWHPAPVVAPPPGQTFSIEEIRKASRGFFGTVSSSLANVLEHAFSKLGRPSGYVLGKEGGGAFLAGVRYGKGKLFTRDGAVRQVYWHGPSIGYDFGAAGSRTMFLVYNLPQANDLFAVFSGIDGSAYLVGGVGIAFLTDGRVVMAPIRSGIGLRLGANIGYVRFTPRSTWNPF